MNLTQLQERDNLDLCSAPYCRHQSAIIYSPGATPANPRLILTLCDEHHAEFCEQPESRHDRGTVRTAPVSSNQCDGCNRDLPLDEDGFHIDPTNALGLLGCDADLYEEEPKPEEPKPEEPKRGIHFIIHSSYDSYRERPARHWDVLNADGKPLGVIVASFNEASIIDGYTIKIRTQLVEAWHEFCPKAGIVREWPISWRVIDSPEKVKAEDVTFQVCPDEARKDPKVKSVLSFIKRTLKSRL